MRRGKSAVRTDNITAVRTDNITAKRNKEKQTKQWFTKHYTEKIEQHKYMLLSESFVIFMQFLS